MNVLSLFSGIGGIDLGLERAGFRTVAFCEADPFCQAVLRKHWPNIPCHPDVRGLSGAHVPDVDIIAGGFPCQDISTAGLGAGIEGERSGLWREFARLIRELRPRWVLVENVAALRARGADRVLSDLERSGYSAWATVVGAWAVGAPHRRDRAWIIGQLADANDGRISNPARGSHVEGRRAAEARSSDLPEGLLLARVASDDRPPSSYRDELVDAASVKTAISPRSSWPARPGEQQYEWEARRLAQFPMDSAGDGVSARLVRAANRNALRAYGNAVVPQVVEVIGRAILKAANGAAQ